MSLIVFIYFYMACINYLFACVTVFQEYLIKNKIIITVSLIGIVFVLMSIWNAMIARSRDKYKAQIKQYEDVVYKQQCHVQDVLDSDENLRKYRHDVNMHFTAMSAICERGNSEELVQYAQEMLYQIEHIQVRTYTGNSAVDAILGNLIDAAKKNGIPVCYETSLPDELSISAFDLCTILSNLIQNAIDACMELSVKERKKGIHVIVYPMNDSIYMKVENPTNHVISIQDNVLHSTKKEQKNHGFGSKNIKQVVEKHQGRLNYYCKDGLFVAEVFL